MAMYAGQGVGLIKEIVPAAEVVKSLVAESKESLEKSFLVTSKIHPELQARTCEVFE